MKVSHSHFAGPTGKPVPKRQTERTNSPSLMEPKDSSPDHFERSQTASLPSPPNQQEITDSNRQQPFQKKLRPSQYELFEDILPSEQADDECESTDKEIRKKEKRISKKRISISEYADNLGIPVAELRRLQRQVQGERLGINFAELLIELGQCEEEGYGGGIILVEQTFLKQRREELAGSLGISVAELERKQEPFLTRRRELRQERQAQAETLGVPVAELERQQAQALADGLGIDAAELEKRQSQALDHIRRHGR